MIYTINSSDRNLTLSTSTSNFIIEMPIIDIDYKKMKVLNYKIPLSIYNVSSTYSTNIFIVEETGTPRTITLTAGLYTTTTLPTQIQTQLNSGGGSGYTVLFDNITQKLTFSNSTAFKILLSGYNKMAEFLGFPASDTTSATSHVSTYCVSMTPIRNLFLCVNELKTNIKCSSQFQKATPCAILPYNCNINNFTFNDTEIEYNIQSMSKRTNWEIKLIDDTGEIAELNNINWSITLCLY